jgi:para-nitrobenzyl esterase
MIVTTASGPVAGTETAGIRRYLGIPYARAPFGAHRFGAPTPPQPWTSPLAADRFGPTAPKSSEPAGGLPEVPEPMIAGDECLNINVWTGAPVVPGPGPGPVPGPGPGPVPGPAAAASAGGPGKRPVLVWIHGGGFFAGCSANPWYDGTAFARDGLVFVSFNYRLGAEGFADIPGAPPNRGVLDWIAALEWVRDNIAAFGGDPANVTVFGQSAGGMAIMTLLAIPAVSGLFHRAIICSGVSKGIAIPLSDARATSLALAKELGIDPTVAGFASRTPEELVVAQVAVEARLSPGLSVEVLELGRSPLLWAPVRDEKLIVADPLSAVRAGAGSSIPLLVGTTHDEFGFRYYLEDLDDPRGQRLVDAIFRRPTQALVDARRDAAPTYRYEFCWPSTAYGGAVRAGHSLDICFFFDTLGAPFFERYAGRPGDQTLADFEHAQFVRFALTGATDWPAYWADGARTVQLFDEQSSVATQFVVA